MLSGIKQYKIKNIRNLSLNMLEGVSIEKPRAVALNLHGMGSCFQLDYKEDSLIYRNNLFKNNNIKSYAFEFIGHGKSDGIRCSIDNFDDFVDDLDTVVKFIKKKEDNIPIFIISESMGGAVAIKYCIKNQLKSKINGYILVGPMCGLDDSLKPHPILISLLLFFSKYFPNYPAIGTKVDVNGSCKNKEFTKLKENSEYFFNEQTRLNTGRELYNTSLWIEENGDLFNAPVYVLHGLDDKITNPEFSIKFYNSVVCKNKDIYLPTNTNHSLFIRVDDNDKGPIKTWENIINWINLQIK